MEILKDSLELDKIMERLVEVARRSTCERSKCGSIIVNGYNYVVAEGYNSMPCNVSGECFKDKLDPTFKSDKTCCVHAEQRAIISGLEQYGSLYYTKLFFIRLDENDNPKHSGKPYCSICSKMALDVGISQFMLWHKEGWTAYDTDEYNRLTFEYNE